MSQKITSKHINYSMRTIKTLSRSLNISFFYMCLILHLIKSNSLQTARQSFLIDAISSVFNFNKFFFKVKFVQCWNKLNICFSENTFCIIFREVLFSLITQTWWKDFYKASYHRKCQLVILPPYGWNADKVWN